MSEPLKPEEVVKFGDQVRKIFGWIKKFLKRSPAIITVAILSYGTISCEFLRVVVRTVNTIPIPEPDKAPTPFPTIVPTATPVATGTPVHTPTPIPTIVPTVNPTATPSTNFKYPIIGFQKIQGYNPKPGQDYNCHNPQDGPKFLNQHICVKDTTRYLCDPDNPGNCGPCDMDHMTNWNSFCLQQDYDPRKIRFTAKGATVEETDNPSQWEVHFTPGVPFTACASALPFGQDRSTSGLQLEQKANTETCVTETYH